MNHKISLLALLLLSCSNTLPINFDPENQTMAQEMFCRTMADLQNQCTDAAMMEKMAMLRLEELQNDADCVDLACKMARMMQENADCSFEMIMNAFNDVDAMKVMAAYALCQSCMPDLMTAEETNC